MLLVALVAGLLVAPGELRARRERRHYARAREYCLRLAALNEKQNVHCTASADAAYDSTERQWSQGGVCYSLPVVSDWAAEARWHTQRAASSRSSAGEFDRREKAVRRRLILPVLMDIPKDSP